MMRRHSWIAVVTILLSSITTTPANTQIKPRPLQPLTMSSLPGPRSYAVERVATINGKRLRYRMELGETIIRDQSGRSTASLFATSYHVAGAAPTRPVIFAFNGGPGGPACYLNFGALGPRIFAPGDQIKTNLVDNLVSPLDAADLVFLDPPDTGFSHSLPGADARQFYSIDGDSEAMSQMVVNWLRTHRRLDAPVYLMGESYGTMRAVAMARDLLRGETKVQVAGIILAGNSLGYFQKGQMPDILYSANALPMMASVAWYHGKIDNKGQSWNEAVDKARLFARTTYIGALMQGYQLDAATREKVIRQLPAIIGVPEKYFRDNNTIVVADFLSILLADQRLTVDSDDGRITHKAGEPANSRQYSLYGKMMDRFAGDFGAVTLGTYVPINVTLNPRWDYYTAGAMALDVTLAQVMKTSPKIRVMMAQGRYDTLTTLGNSEYIIRQADLAWPRYQEAYYDGGHSVAPTSEIITQIRNFVRP